MFDTLNSVVYNVSNYYHINIKIPIMYQNSSELKAAARIVLGCQGFVVIVSRFLCDRLPLCRHKLCLKGKSCVVGAHCSDYSNSLYIKDLVMGIHVSMSIGFKLMARRSISNNGRLISIIINYLHILCFHSYPILILDHEIVGIHII